MHGAVLDWYRGSGRPLAFRQTADPWAILVSEFMAQQTQAARAAEAWAGFLERFPTPSALAASTPADVLRAWRGLGYNRRALALRSAAIAIVERHGGSLPSAVEALDALPGVGPYTARAVAALAFGRRVGAVDTNVRRVLSRALFDGPPSARALQAAADALVPAEQPGAWTHALMDVGATFCRPRNPRCGGCPLKELCRFAAARPTVPPTVPTPSRARSAPPKPAFAATSRWLRGRILDRLRDAPEGVWVDFAKVAMGDHAAPAVESALAGLARDRLVELQPHTPASARLPLA